MMATLDLFYIPVDHHFLVIVLYLFVSITTGLTAPHIHT